MSQFILQKGKFYQQIPLDAAGAVKLKYVAEVTLRNLIIKKQVSPSDLEGIRVPPKESDTCKVTAACYDRCVKCPVMKTYTVFGKDSIKNCLGTTDYCWYPYSDKDLLYSTLCSICNNTQCAPGKKELTLNHPVRVSNDGINFKNRHFAFAGKSRVYCYSGGATSATTTKIEPWRFMKDAADKHNYSPFAAVTDFRKVYESGRCQLEENALVSISPNFMHRFYYTTGTVTEKGVEVFSAGETTWSGTDKIILEFPIWELR